MPEALDISDTPNRLLYSLLSSQAIFSPGIVNLPPGDMPASLSFILQHQPSAPVTVDISVPLAAWAGTPLAVLDPSSLTIQPSAWNMPKAVTITPTSIADGNFHLNFTFT